MYLSVPLPNAMERPLVVTYIPINGENPVRSVISLNKHAKVIRLKEELLKTIGKVDVPVSTITMAEVLDLHISRIIVSTSNIFFYKNSNILKRKINLNLLIVVNIMKPE